jgi:mercuric ion transport protein
MLTPMTEGDTDAGRKCVKVGALGSLLAALCCFTPLLVLLLGFAGLGALVVYLDYLLLPALGVFLVTLFVGLWRLRHQG